MSNSLEFGEGSSTGGNSVFGGPRDWVRTKNGIGLEATYARGRPKQPDFFFSVVWQMKVERPGRAKNAKWPRTIHLQVESPRHNRNPSLNDLKRKVIMGLLDADLGSLVHKDVYEYDDRVGCRTSDDQIRERITITPFKLVLVDEDQAEASPKEKIKAVHRTIGWKVDAILKQFEEEIERHFGL